MSLIFNPTNKLDGRADLKEFNFTEMNNFFWLINYSNKNFTNPLVNKLFKIIYLTFYISNQLT